MMLHSELPIIDVRGLTKRYGDRTVVDQVDVRIQRGSIYGFLGPNGSGKTTTIRMLCGLLTPDAGEGTCLGYDLRRQTSLIKPQVGYMTQKFSLYEDLSIEENLTFIARIYEIKNRHKKVTETLENLDLYKYRKQLAGTLSGGWKQRLALAACLLHEPKLLLLDEATAGVDPKARREFWDQLHMLAAAGLTVLVSTHYMDEAERCHELAYISYGKLLTHGSAEKIIAEEKLVTCEISGLNAQECTNLMRLLRADPRICTTTSFGSKLHVSTYSTTDLNAALAPFLTERIDVVFVDTSLEDVFIALMKKSHGNFTEKL